ncbi:UNVERIFIED_CONTAM: hypothetical protein Slati_0965300 [Sesamum latifolium]|uniref:Uncharacterized protein n=1 Tax=Sesamum latifolium TaxID=2727402 RepID=A0AAW2XR93_9LAMI
MHISMIFLRLGVLLVLYLILAWVSFRRGPRSYFGRCRGRGAGRSWPTEGGTVEEKVLEENLPQPVMEDVVDPSKESQVQEESVEVGEKAPIVG